MVRRDGLDFARKEAAEHTEDAAPAAPQPVDAFPRPARRVPGVATVERARPFKTAPRIREKPERLNISIIIVTWNGKRYAEEVLDSLHAYVGNPRAEVIVVDNASTDGTPEMIASSYVGVKLIRNDKNLGFAKANNVGIRNSSGEFVLLVNSDVVVQEGCIEKLIEYMKQNPRVGRLGPKMLGADGKAYRSYMAELTLWRCFCRALALDDLFPNSKLLGGYLMPDFKMDRVPKRRGNGWFWVTRREALNEVGLMDDTLACTATTRLVQTPPGG